jgi:cob(I)alamin adenosyltransferase
MSLVPVTSLDDIHRLGRYRGGILVFKHSTRCSISTAAHHRVQTWLAAHPDAEVGYVDVIAQALRVAGQGTEVLLAQPFQVGINQGLQNPRRLMENLTWFRCEADRDLAKDDIDLTDGEKLQILELWEYAKRAIQSALAGLVVIDQANLLVARSLVSEDELLSVIKMRSPKVSVILTGTSMPPSIADFADQVTQRRS